MVEVLFRVPHILPTTDSQLRINTVLGADENLQVSRYVID